MARRQSDDEGFSIIRLFLIAVIFGGLGYLAYDHWDYLKTLDINSLKQMVGLGEPPAPAPAYHPPHPSSSENSASTTASTNGAPAIPTIGRPRPDYPAQDHWTWTTSDGKTYNDVKIEKVEPGFVTIIHADGGARVPISTLPDDLQKQLNYFVTQPQ